MEQLKYNIIKHIEKNIVLYIIVIFVFLAGITSGAFTIKAISIDQKSNLSNYLNQYTTNISKNTVDRWAIFLQSTWQHLYNSTLLWAFGLFFICIPLIFTIIGIRGFFIGFTVGFLVSYYGFKGFLFSMLCILPQMFIYIPCLLGMGILSVDNGIENFRKRKYKAPLKQKLKNNRPYTSKFLIIFLAVFVGILFETFITPTFFKLFSDTFS